MKTTLSQHVSDGILNRLNPANQQFTQNYPGVVLGRQPVHTMYGGAQLFKADLAPKMGKLALKTLAEYGPNFAAFGRAVGLTGAEYLPASLDKAVALEQKLQADPEAARQTNEPAWLAYTIYSRVVEKLNREAVEDFRIDFEDGYGNRPDAEEDSHAQSVAEEVVKGMKDGTLPPFIGIRIKPLTEELCRRSLRTLDIFLTALLEKTQGQLPPNFVVTLPKVTLTEQVTAFVETLEVLENTLSLPVGTVKMELMVEATQSLINPKGQIFLPLLVEAARGRCTGAHFGTYDYTASCNITAAYQHMTHASCNFARHVMQVALGGTGLMLSDGATNIMPIPPYRAADGGSLNSLQTAANLQAVHQAWKLHYDHIQHSLSNGYYQGWDLHPNQLPTRYAALYDFFLRELSESTLRLRTFVEKAAQATLVGDVFDDAATGQGLLNFFRRALSCGAITDSEIQAAGISTADLTGTSGASPWLRMLEEQK